MKLRKINKMLILKNSYDFMFKYFCIVVVALLIASFANAWFAGNTWAIYEADLARILLISLFAILPSLACTIFIETISAKGVLVKNIIQFCLTALLTLSAYAIIEPSGSGLTFDTLITFLIVYAVIFIYSTLNAVTIEIKEKELADQINEKLNEIHNAQNESHID